ncbi:MAG TPA: hypothetical protein VMB18_10280 [Terriglobales bacterium]|nr:hypothetical protein [Terriglobales bacterium]
MRRACCLLLLVLIAVAAMAQQGSVQAESASAQISHTTSTPSEADIAAAKAAHKVWVNLDTGIYHKGGRWYGKTKNGKFMTTDEAKKAGYKAAKRD